MRRQIAKCRQLSLLPEHPENLEELFMSGRADLLDEPLLMLSNQSIGLDKKEAPTFG